MYAFFNVKRETLSVRSNNAEPISPPMQLLNQSINLTKGKTNLNNSGVISNYGNNTFKLSNNKIPIHVKNHSIQLQFTYNLLFKCIYCKNKLNTNELRLQCAHTHTFKKECQNKLK